MLEIYIARHGQNEDNVEGILNGHRNRPLTERGLQQARELADEIRKRGLTFNTVYSSPLVRAHKTAEVVCQALGFAAPLVLDTLIERDFGVMTGKPIADIERLCAPDIVKTETITYFLSPPGAETFPTLLERARRALEHVRALHQSGHVLLVTHGDIGKMLYAAYYGLSWIDTFDMFHFGNCELHRLAEGVDPSQTHVVKITQHNH